MRLHRNWFIFWNKVTRPACIQWSVNQSILDFLAQVTERVRNGLISNTWKLGLHLTNWEDPGAFQTHHPCFLCFWFFTMGVNECPNLFASWKKGDFVLNLLWFLHASSHLLVQPIKSKMKVCTFIPYRSFYIQIYVYLWNEILLSIMFPLSIEAYKWRLKSTILHCGFPWLFYCD